MLYTNEDVIPERVQEVLDKIACRMKDDIRETGFQSMTRLETEFDNLDMRGKTHSEFRSLWEAKIDEMEEYGCLPDTDTLRRRSLCKITDNLR